MRKLVWIIPLLIFCGFAPFSKKELVKEVTTVTERLENRDHTALRVMRDYRLKMLKEESPRSNWKLIEANGRDDIIFEWSVPKAGAFQEKYHLERIIVGEYSYQKISLETDRRPKDIEKCLAQVREYPAEVKVVSRFSPKQFS